MAKVMAAFFESAIVSLLAPSAEIAASKSALIITNIPPDKSRPSLTAFV